MPENAANGQQKRDDLKETIWGLKIPIKDPFANEHVQGYEMSSFNRDSFHISTEKSGNQKVTLIISFELEGSKIDQLDLPDDDENNNDTNINSWEKFGQNAFLGFEESTNNSLKHSKKVEADTTYIIDTKQMPLLTLKPFNIDKKNKGCYDKPTLKFIPTIEDNDANVKFCFSFNVNAVIPIKNSTTNTESNNDSKSLFLLFDIGYTRLGESLVSGLNDVNRAFKVGVLKVQGNMNLMMGIQFDIDQCELISNTDLSEEKLISIDKGEKVLIPLNNFTLSHISSETANTRAEFSFLLIDSLLIGASPKTAGSSDKTAGSSGKTAGSSGKTAGSSGKTAGSSGKTIGSSGKTIGSSSLVFV